jgi:hypothetical protein
MEPYMNDTPDIIKHISPTALEIEDFSESPRRNKKKLNKVIYSEKVTPKNSSNLLFKGLKPSHKH